MATLKCVILGQENVGKSAFIETLATVNPGQPATVTLESNKGPINFEFYEDGTRVDCGNPDCLMMMFDLTNRGSLEVLPSTYDLYRFVYDIPADIPTALCGTKVDLPDRALSTEDISQVNSETEFAHFELSSMTRFNIMDPLTYFARQIVDPDLVFV